MLILLALLLGAAPAPAAAARPNIVFILADDLGYGDLGAYGQTKIRTPRLDRMAREGTRFTQFYAGSPVCAPSRSALMTGQHTGHTYIRGNKEHPAGQEPLPDPVTRTASRHATASTNSSGTTTSAGRTSTIRSTCIAMARRSHCPTGCARSRAARARAPPWSGGATATTRSRRKRWPFWTGTAVGRSSSTSPSPSRMRSCRRRTMPMLRT